MISSGGDLEAQFSLESERGGVVEERPFHVLVMGDWSAGGRRKPLSERPVIEIDRDNFDQVLADISPTLDVEVGGCPLTIGFSTLDDFHPDRLYEQVPLFAEFRGLRGRLRNNDTFDKAARELRLGSEVSESTSIQTDQHQEGVDSGDLLGQILARKTDAAPLSRKSPDDLSGLVSELVRPYLVKVDEDEQDQMVAVVDRAASELMRTLIHDRRFRELEAAWRGLYFFVRRAETGADLKIFVLDATREELSENLKSESDLEDTFVSELLSGNRSGQPWAVVAGNYGFRPNVDDAAALVRISKICSSANVPFISHMRPEILGISSFEGYADPKEWQLLSDSGATRLWSTLRSMPESEYLGMSIPRFLGRLPYGFDTEPLETFAFEEFVAGPDHDKLLWINPAFACALLLAQSFSAGGWEMGRSLVNDLERLPLYTYTAGGQTVYQPCAEVQLSHRAADVLAEYGLMPLVSFKDSDRIQITRFQSIADPPTVLRGRWSQS